MWMVYDSEEGLVLTTDDYDEALKEYEFYKEGWKETIKSYGEFDETERVVLAEVKKDFYAAETVHKNDEGEYYWDWTENHY